MSGGTARGLNTAGRPTQESIVSGFGTNNRSTSSPSWVSGGDWETREGEKVPAYGAYHSNEKVARALLVGILEKQKTLKEN